MASFFPLSQIIFQYDKVELANHWLKAYEAGTTTPRSLYTDAAGSVAVAKIELDTEGFPVTAGNARVTPYIGAGDFDLWLFPTEADADNNDTASAIQLADDRNGKSLQSDGPTQFETLTALGAGSGFVVNEIYAVQGVDSAGDGGAANWKCISISETGGSAGFDSSTGKYRVDNGDATFSEFEHTGSILDVRAVGVVADGSTDNSSALEVVLAIKKPALYPVGIVSFATAPANGVPVHEGLDWKGASRGLTDSPNSSETVLRYTGAGVAFYWLEPNGINGAGGMSFSSMTVECTQSGASAFRFNNPAVAPTDDATTPNYIRQIQFKAVSLRGAKGAGSRGIDATGVFELTTDENCESRGFERGVSLYGCDNCSIAGRHYLNGRQIHVNRVNTFGNDNEIPARFCGTPDTSFTAENRYNIYDNGSHTVITGVELENVTPSSSSLMYINGSGCRYYGVDFSSNGNAPYDLGPSAKDIASFGAKTTGTLGIPNVSAPSEIDRPNTLNFPGITFYGASQRFLDRIGNPLRTRVGETESATVGTNLSRLGRERFTPNGVGISHVAMGAFNYFGQSTGLGWSEPNLVEDTDSYNGTAIQLEPVSLRGFAIGLKVGEFLNEGDTLKILVRYKMSGIPASGSFRWYRGINGTLSANSALPNSTTYATQEVNYTLSGFSDGDFFRFGCYNSGVTDETCNIAVIRIQIVEAGVSDLNQAISGAYSQSQVQDISDKVDEILTALRNSGVIGG